MIKDHTLSEKLIKNAEEASKTVHESLFLVMDSRPQEEFIKYRLAVGKTLSAIYGDGFHVCLRALSIQQVEAFFKTAIELGACSEGAPGFREQYDNAYYAAFMIDNDGNKVEVVTFVDR